MWPFAPTAAGKRDKRRRRALHNVRDRARHARRTARHRAAFRLVLAAGAVAFAFGMLALVL